MFRKKVDIFSNNYPMETYEENVTEIGGRIITKINTTRPRMIIMSDKNGLIVVELFVPDTFMVKICYV